MHNANIAPRGKGGGKMPQFDKLLRKCPKSFDQGCLKFILLSLFSLRLLCTISKLWGFLSISHLNEVKD